MSNIEKVNNILENVEAFFLATVNGDKPKVRPLGQTKSQTTGSPHITRRQNLFHSGNF